MPDATCNTGASPTPTPTPTSTPIPTPTPTPDGFSGYAAGVVYNDPNQECNTANNGGWQRNDPVYNSNVTVYFNATRSSWAELQADFHLSRRNKAKINTLLGIRGAPFAVDLPLGLDLPPAFRPRTNGNRFVLDDLPPGYRCSDCNTNSCPNRTNVTLGMGGYDFYITNQGSVPTPTPTPVPKGAWWQAEGAGVYVGSQAGGVVVRSDLPSLTSLILPGSGGTSGVLVRGSGTVGLGSGSLSSESWSALARYRGKRMDYSYFGANMGVLKNSPGSWAFNNQIDLTTYPSGSDFGYRNGDGLVVDPITVGVGESYVIFVNGNLSIEDNITVANGGFLAFVVKGNVNVSPSVQVMQGIYLSDGDFVTQRFDPTGTFDDVALGVEGTVVSWGSFNLGRELGILNNSTPAEKFSYRSDFLTNMPDKMKTFAMEWQEVAAGSFE